MAILEEDIARVRAQIDVVEVVSEHMALKKAGRRWTGLCPFHAEKSPSFSINAEEGLYYCFGCHAKGDVISFIREVEHISFVEAVEKLAGRVGIEVRHDSQAVSAERKKRSVLIDAMQKAVDWYHERLLSAPDASPARSYLRERGYDSEAVRQFKIGWAPEGWDELSRSLKLPNDVLKETGLGFVNRRARQQDAFRGRVMFPIFDVSGAPVAFGGRILPGHQKQSSDQGYPEPKYKNSSETPLYNKSRVLYALNWAKQDVVTDNEVIVCEGYTDVIAFFRSGMPRAVATCGTALTEEHVRTLKSFATRIVLAYDADSAGQAAAERFYEWEKKLGIDISVIALPKGSDPADAARRDPAMLATAVKDAKPFLAFRLDRVLQSSDMRSIEGRSKAAERCVAMIAEHPSPGVRHQYLQLVEGWTKVPASELERIMSGAEPGGAGSSSSGGLERPGSTNGPRQAVVDLRNERGFTRRVEEGPLSAEWEALRVAVHRPEDVAQLLEALVPANAPTGVEDALFVDPRSRAAFRALSEAATLTEAIASAEPEAADLLSRLVVEEENGTEVDDFIRLIDHAANRSIRELEIESRVGDGYAEAAANISWLKLSIEQLRDPTTSLDAAAALVEWLLERSVREEMQH